MTILETENRFTKMKNIKIIFAISFFILLFSCRNDDCYTPPELVIFELLNSNNENIISNGSIDIPYIYAQQNVGNGNSNGVQLKKTDDNKIILQEIGFFEGSKDYTLFLAFQNEVKKFNFTVQSSKRTGNCAGYKIDAIDFTDIVGVKENGFYKIFLQ